MNFSLGWGRWKMLRVHIYLCIFNFTNVHTGDVTFSAVKNGLEELRSEFNKFPDFFVYIYIYIYIYIRAVFNRFPYFFVQASKIVVDS